MYTKNNYKDEIKNILQGREYDPILIAKKTYEIYLSHMREIDNSLRDNLLDIATMENGSEFEMTEEEFNQFIEKI